MEKCKNKIEEMKLDVVLMNRCKRKGAHSIEEIFQSISDYSEQLEMKYVPTYKINIISIFKNIIYAYKNKGHITHITGDIHYTALVTGKRTILTIHDLGSLYKNTRAYNHKIKKLLWLTLPVKFASKITVISSFTKNELLNTIPGIEEKIHVIPNPVNPMFEHIPKKFNEECPYILHIGTKPNKNLENTIHGIKGMNCKLIIVGELNNDQKKLLNECNTDFTNYVNIPFHEIVKLYYSCDIVSFISFYEGFGMPAIEAQRVGRVLITSNIKSISEVASNGAHYVDPHNIADIRNAFHILTNSEPYRNQLIKNGLINSNKYNIEFIAKQYFELYKSLQ